jgi:hypothetical protein
MPSLDISDEKAVGAVNLLDLTLTRGDLDCTNSLASLFSESFNRISWLDLADFQQLLHLSDSES